PVAGMVLLILGVIGVLLAAARAISRPLPYAAAAGVCGLLLLGFAGMSWVKQDPKMANRQYARLNETAAKAPQPEGRPPNAQMDQRAPAKEANDPGLPRPAEGPGGVPPAAAPADKAPLAKFEDKAKDMPARGGEG